MSRGALITIEGLDGAGKTTLALALQAELEREGSTSRLLREPGGVETSERLRDLVKDPDLDRRRANRGAAVRGRARATRGGGDSSRSCARGDWVLLDRFVDSWLAYQGGGPRPRDRAGPRDQRVRHRRPARPTARCS